VAFLGSLWDCYEILGLEKLRCMNQNGTTHDQCPRIYLIFAMHE